VKPPDGDGGELHSGNQGARPEPPERTRVVVRLIG
jgi:hypothetical protein